MSALVFGIHHFCWIWISSLSFAFFLFLLAQNLNLYFEEARETKWSLFLTYWSTSQKCAHIRTCLKSLFPRFSFFSTITKAVSMTIYVGLPIVIVSNHYFFEIYLFVRNFQKCTGKLCLYPNDYNVEKISLDMYVVSFKLNLVYINHTRNKELSKQSIQIWQDDETSSESVKLISTI